MIALALLLQAATLPHYADIPDYSRRDVHTCSMQFDRLQTFVQRFKTYVSNREVDSGGKIPYSQSNTIRNAADNAARPYLEGIRKIAYTGAVAQCTSLANQGVRDVTENVIRPVFGQ